MGGWPIKYRMYVPFAESLTMHIETAGMIEQPSLKARPQVSAGEVKDAGEKPAVQDFRDGIRVTLSERARAQSDKAQKSNDVDNSDLPDNIKQLIKMIRELKAQIAEKQAELAALMQDQSLDPEARDLQAKALQSELATLIGALASAHVSLAKAMRDQDLSDEQIQNAMTLVMN